MWQLVWQLCDSLCDRLVVMTCELCTVPTLQGDPALTPLSATRPRHSLSEETHGGRNFYIETKCNPLRSIANFMKCDRKNGWEKSNIFSGRDQNNETFCLDQKTKDKESEWNKILYLVENENGSKKKKEVLEEDISISVDPEREMDKVKPKRRMP